MPLPAGTYYWRIKPLGGGGLEGPWLGPIQIGIVAFPPGALGVQAERVLGIAPISQNKDSRMLCLDGDPEGNPASNDPENAWDAPAPCTVPPCADGGIKYTHGNRYCVRASIRMMASYYGGHLTMDRISYYILQEWTGNTHGDTHDTNPNNDLGHNRGMWYPDEEDEGISWALGTTITTPGGKPTFAQVKGWIDANRPIMFRDPGHMMVIDGYRDDASGQFVHILDPDQEPDFWRWQTYASQDIDGYWVGPASAPGVRSDEATVSADSDGDGIVDFDEINRFHTNPILPDSDEDWVQDKQDIREYVFDNAGTYNLRAADFDGDGHRKERDADNDGDGAADGCEDTNYNGKYEAALGETDNFNAGSSQACVPLFEILQPTQSTPVNAGAYDNPDKILVQVRTATPPSSPVTYGPSDFAVEIGGLDSAVIAVYQVLDTHFLVVSPHTQPAADTYDLEVTLRGTQSDTETRAVYFLPKLRADQMLVIDRSGSMSDYGKMDAAKNAARAFIDHANVGDMIGVASFASSASLDYSLTTITGDPEWNAAKAVVNALVSSGMTALGQGAQTGYNEIVAKGKSDHDWAMALLSDGMENVTPYWADPTVSGVIVPSRVVVHTVALGRDADRTLMAAIAGSTGGTAYEAGVDILPLVTGASAAAPPGPNLPSTLPNRLADVYKAIGEEIGHQQRLWEKTGTVSGHLQFEVPLEKGLPEAIFTVNWDDPGSPIQMTLYDPKGDQVKAGYPGMSHQTDTTHDQYRIRNPLAGVWVVELRTREKMANYLFILSAWSPTTMHLAFGLPPAERTVGSEIPILVVLADTKRIKGAEVWAWVQGPDADLVQVLQLFDDGAHHDGRSGDGVYGNLFTHTYQAGAYLVKASGWGVNNFGESFVRHRTGGFTILPRLAYIWREDLTTANAYRNLLQANGFTVDFVHLDDVPKTSWTRYSLAVIGPETGDGAQWGTPTAVATLQQYPVPIIGLGEGGYAFFGKVGLAIGYPNGWHGSENRTYVMDTAHQVWHSPYHIPVPRERIVTVYNRSGHVGINIPKPPADVTLIGREPADQVHYNLVQQTGRYLLWGFQAGPPAMTVDGQRLFINVARYMAGM
ncbi:MAG: VWA domain-containing protein [Anaerolineae bacterium]|nr:VWA domain-containing protein [Anaerolineae bacterium]